MGMIQFLLSNQANQSEFCMDFACIYSISSFFLTTNRFQFSNKNNLFAIFFRKSFNGILK